MIALMVEQPIWGFNFDGVTYDCGTKLGFLLANDAIGLARADIGLAPRSAIEKMLPRAVRGDASFAIAAPAFPAHSDKQSAAEIRIVRNHPPF